MRSPGMAALAALAFLLLGAPPAAQALSGPGERPLPTGIRPEDREAIEALVLYPAPLRRAILQVASRPGILKEIGDIQAWSRREFQRLLATHPPEVQATLQELARYPGLIPALAEGGESRRARVEIAASYPSEIREAAIACGGTCHAEVVRVHGLARRTDEAFGKVLSGVSPETRAAFREVLLLPEVLTLLVEHPHMTTLLGDAYLRDPASIEAELSELNLVVAREGVTELEAGTAMFGEEPGEWEEHAYESHGPGYPVPPVSSYGVYSTYSYPYVPIVYRYGFTYGWLPWYPYAAYWLYDHDDCHHYPYGHHCSHRHPPRYLYRDGDRDRVGDRRRHHVEGRHRVDRRRHGERDQRRDRDRIERRRYDAGPRSVERPRDDGERVRHDRTRARRRDRADSPPRIERTRADGRRRPARSARQSTPRAQRRAQHVNGSRSTASPPRAARHRPPRSVSRPVSGSRVRPSRHSGRRIR